MRFFIKRKRQPPAVIIVAMIDVLIVVLIFLMVTTSFKKQQASLKLVLPESTQATRAGASDKPPLVISIEENGTLRYGDEAKPMTAEELRQALLADAAKNPALKLSISADRKAPLGQVVKVIDAAKEAKVGSLGIFTKEAGKPQ